MLLLCTFPTCLRFNRFLFGLAINGYRGNVSIAKWPQWAESWRRKSVWLVKSGFYETCRPIFLAGGFSSPVHLTLPLKRGLRSWVFVNLFSLVMFKFTGDVHCNPYMGCEVAFPRCVLWCFMCAHELIAHHSFVHPSPSQSTLSLQSSSDTNIANHS